MTIEESIKVLQQRADYVVHWQLADAWGYKPYVLTDKRPYDPDMVIIKTNGDQFYLYIQGSDINAGITSRDSQWKATRIEWARQEEFEPHFLEVAILDRSGNGNGVFIRGLAELKEMLSPSQDTIVDWQKGEQIPIPDQGEDCSPFALGPEQTKEKFLEEKNRIEGFENEQFLKEALLKTKGKPIDVIPDDVYCYSSEISEDKMAQWEDCINQYGNNSGEAYELYGEIREITFCPYREWTDYGTVKCHFLEEETVGWKDESYKKALEHFGSEEKLEEACRGNFLLGDAVKCCNLIVERIKEISKETSTV